jgi:hypothetical protein
MRNTKKLKRLASSSQSGKVPGYAGHTTWEKRQNVAKKLPSKKRTHAADGSKKDVPPRAVGGSEGVRSTPNAKPGRSNPRKDARGSASGPDGVRVGPEVYLAHTMLTRVRMETLASSNAADGNDPEAELFDVCAQLLDMVEVDMRNGRVGPVELEDYMNGE